MRNFSVALLTLLLIAVACNSNKTVIKANIEGLNKGEVVLKVLRVNNQIVVDTIKTDGEGLFVYKNRELSKLPEFYYLYYKDQKIASLLLSAGDKVYITADTLGDHESVSGSGESILLNEIEREILKMEDEFEITFYNREQALKDGNNALADTLNYRLGAIFVKGKQSAIKHIYSNPYSLTNIYLLYHRVAGQLPLFGDYKDALIMRRVHDSLLVAYPNSQYLRPLIDEINYREKSEVITGMFESAGEISIPEIKLPDTKSQIRNITDLIGKPILLVFWSVTDVNQKMFNRDLLALYEKYSSHGLQIYQVCVDTDKTVWAKTVSGQGLPWINVCDGLGGASPAISAYNITEVPTIYIIDRDGNIVDKNLFDSRLDRAISKLF